MADHVHVYISFTHFNNVESARNFCVDLINEHHGYGYTMINILDNKHSNIIESRIIGSDVDHVLIDEVLNDKKRT